MKEIKVTRALPHLWVHDDRTVEPCHFVRRWRARQSGQFIVAGEHVVPPAFLEITLEGNTQRAVIPKPV